ATLDLPPGLSLAPLATPQTRRQDVAAIAGGTSRTASWIVRGDTEGAYNLSALYTSTLDPIGLPVELLAKTEKPLRVWGASALETTIRVDEKAFRWGPYQADVEVKNVSDVPVYNMQVEMLN